MQFERNMTINHNVRFNVYDMTTGQLVKSYEGHNQATNTMLTGMAHYLMGDGILNQGFDTLRMYLPRYISLGTMGLFTQEETSDHLPKGIGTLATAPDMESPSWYEDETRESKIARYTAYMQQTPGYGSDGYMQFVHPSEDGVYNHNRDYYGLGPKFADRADDTKTINCELISDSFQRAKISYRAITPEDRSEKPQTLDVVFSAMISTGALAQFREPDKDYVFITEAGLWSTPVYDSNNMGAGLVAGYRIAPPNENNWDMNDVYNQQKLQEQVIRVGKNQVVQVVWKVQIGSLSQLTSRVYDTSIYIGVGEFISGGGE